jgi:O-antigen/teichoic acid export membrane protein
MLSGIVIIGMLARYLGLSDFGEYSIVMAIVWTTLPIISMAVPRTLVVEISRDPSKAARYIGNGITWNIWVFIAIGLCLWLIDMLVVHLPLYYFVGLSISLFITLTQTVGTIYIANERMKYEIYTSFTSYFMLLLLTGGVTFFDLGLEKVFMATSVAYFCGFIAAVLLGRKVAGLILVPMVDRHILRKLLAGSFALSLIQVLVQLHIYCGVLFLKNMSGNIEVALYQAPMRIFTRFMIIPLSITVALMPIFSRLAVDPEKKHELMETTNIVFKLFMLISMLITIVAYTSATEVISLILGKNFMNAIVGFRIVVLGTIFFFINQFYVMLCMSSGNFNGFSLMKMVEFIVCILLNLAIVPAYGHIGSFWALIVSSCLMSMGGYVYFRGLFRNELLKSISLIMVSGFGTIAMLDCMPPMNFIIPPVLGIFCFSAVMIVSQVIVWRDILPVLNIIRRKIHQGRENK